MSDYNTDSAKGQCGIHICINLPDGTHEGSFVRLPLASIDSAQVWWEWDGNRESPTLNPSINMYPNWNRPGWHGFMRAGKLESC